ncbi:hypothetical protein [Rossellomorea aquimaris]|uniref:Uncharacterized protein n=1 Tax=Rossellomorea aquimaris TaxID=189382 RepID=A0A366EV52_9BACI|nr:hypothetical protein [Rossellomorea aquimaris]RBP06214.1 hypothetical protein DET59_103346 [Rossellomorea aquimaris]
MSKDYLTNVISLGVVLAIAGFIMLFFNVYFGTSSADAWLAGRGEADMGYYHLVIRGYMNTFLVGGGILFVMGLVPVFWGYHQLQLIKESDS